MRGRSRNEEHYDEIAKWIKEYSKKYHGLFPTLRELMAAGFALSTAHASFLVDYLVKSGRVIKDKTETGRVYWYVVDNNGNN